MRVNAVVHYITIAFTVTFTESVFKNNITYNKPWTS